MLSSLRAKRSNPGFLKFFSGLLRFARNDKYLFILLGFVATSTFAHTEFTSNIQPISTAIQEKMQNNSWNPGCPLAMSYLSHVTVSYWGYDGRVHQGELIVNKRVDKEVVAIFKEIFAAHFPIKQIKPMYFYSGDDVKSMEDNNTSAFNCREVTGRPNVFSPHSYGTAIDINPLFNPYVKGETILPPTAKPYLDRKKHAEGMIVKNDSIYRIFTAHGWTWGGDWHTLKDYQHFEKKW